MLFRKVVIEKGRGIEGFGCFEFCLVFFYSIREFVRLVFVYLFN